MRFHSHLETLLRLRRSAEHQQELLLLEVNQRIAALESVITEIQAAKKEIRNRPVHAIQDSIAGSELHFDESCIDALAKREVQLKAQLTAEQRNRELRQQTFYQARREREAVETLITHQREAYTKEETRRQQRRVDDVFLMQSRVRRH
jgi:flagellar export protein FliJ